jgi:hypothetical protein
MNDIIIHLFKYFAQFVPKEALGGVFIQPDRSRMAGYTEIETEIMTSPDTNVIPDLKRYVVSLNENFVSERIKNLKGFLLFIEYGNISVNHDIADGIRQSLTVTVVHPFSDTNGDNLNEVLLTNRALAILDHILRVMNEQQHALAFCGGTLLRWPAEILPIDPVTFYGCGGWSAICNHSFTLL